MKKKILVLGATGLIGKAVAKQLNSDGFSVIVLSRSRAKAEAVFTNEYEIIEGDVLQPESIKFAFQGIHGIYISLPERDVPAALENILKYADESGVKHIVYTSGCTVRKENAWHPMIKGHYLAELALENCGIPYTILKLTMVMDMIPRYANSGKPFIIGKQPHGWSWIYSGDIARMAAEAFRNEKAKNEKFTLFGPDKLSIPMAVDKFNCKFFPQADQAKSRPYWLSHLLAIFVGEKLKYAISIFKYFENHQEEGNTEKANNILGKPQTSIQDFFEIVENDMAQDNK